MTSQNLGSVCDQIKASAAISNSGDEEDADALLTLEGLVVSSRDLDDDRKIELLQFLASLRGAQPSWEVLRHVLHAGKEEGVW